MNRYLAAAAGVLGALIVGLFVFQAGQVSPGRMQLADMYERLEQANTAPATGCQFLDLPYAGVADKKRSLDVYVPKDKSSAPVVVFVHGGSWKDGDKALYGHVGRHMAKAGFVAAVINYRLYPDVKCPTQAEDAATAAAWVADNCPRLGVDPGNVFLCGHSAGGHTVSLLGADPKYLAASGFKGTLRGVVSISGLYNINANVTVAGLGDVFSGVDKKAVSPVYLATAEAPPFLVAYCNKDYRTLEKQAKDFAKTISSRGVEATLLEIKGEDHVSEIVNYAAPQGYAANLYQWMRKKCR